MRRALYTSSRPRATSIILERQISKSGSLKRFEREGLASFELFVAVVACLGRLEELEELFKPAEPLTIAELDQREASATRQRGRR